MKCICLRINKNALIQKTRTNKVTFVIRFFHPDYYRRYRILTDSALRLEDSSLSRFTSGGDLHPALKQICDYKAIIVDMQNL